MCAPVGQTHTTVHCDLLEAQESSVCATIPGWASGVSWVLTPIAEGVATARDRGFLAPDCCSPLSSTTQRREPRFDKHIWPFACTPREDGSRRVSRRQTASIAKLQGQRTGERSSVRRRPRCLLDQDLGHGRSGAARDRDHYWCSKRISLSSLARCLLPKYADRVRCSGVRRSRPRTVRATATRDQI